MKKRWIAGVLCVLVVSISACRQPDGPMPEPAADEQNEIGDISRDLLAVAGGDQQARQDLADDLQTIGRIEGAAPLAPEMAQRLSSAVSGRKLTEEQARAIARQMFVTFSGNTLSQRQVTAIQDDVRAQLTAIGAPESDTTRVVEQIAAVHERINENPRRWWHLR